MPASRKPLAGTMPCGLGLIQMVPPVMTMSTRDSGYWVAMLGTLGRFAWGGRVCRLFERHPWWRYQDPPRCMRSAAPGAERDGSAQHTESERERVRRQEDGRVKSERPARFVIRWELGGWIGKIVDIIRSGRSHSSVGVAVHLLLRVLRKKGFCVCFFFGAAVR